MSSAVKARTDTYVQPLTNQEGIVKVYSKHLTSKGTRMIAIVSQSLSIQCILLRLSSVSAGCTIHTTYHHTTQLTKQWQSNRTLLSCMLPANVCSTSCRAATVMLLCNEERKWVMATLKRCAFLPIAVYISYRECSSAH